MRNTIMLAPVLMLAAGVAAAEPSCKGAATAPMWQAAKSFEDAGGTIQTMKVTNGCYEIYGREDGQKVEVFFDPATGSEMGRE